MSTTNWIELAGTVAFFSFALICAYLAMHVHRFTEIGREALLASAALTFTAALMRVLVLFGFIDREESIVVNSIAACSFVILAVQLAAVRILQSRQERSHHS